MSTGRTKYVMLRKIADGGMAEIFLAQLEGAHGFQKPVVLKRIRPALVSDPQFRDLLIHEAHVAMTLNHSNVVQVLDLGEAEGHYFLVLELVDGWSLDVLIKRARAAHFPLPRALALHVVVETCRALSHAHRTKRNGQPLGLVHRDVSPQNILVSEHGQVKLTDFGIAKARTQTEDTQRGVVKGKIAFMSPEQAQGGELDERSDLFSLGTVLYYLLTDRLPFQSPTALETMVRVQAAEFTSPAKVPLKPKLEGELTRIVLKAMKRGPTERYQSADEMLAAVEGAMRSLFQPAGQTELKRWLEELGSRDHVVPISRTQSSAGPALPAPQKIVLSSNDIELPATQASPPAERPGPPPLPFAAGRARAPVARPARSHRAVWRVLGAAAVTAVALVVYLRFARPAPPRAPIAQRAGPVQPPGSSPPTAPVPNGPGAPSPLSEAAPPIAAPPSTEASAPPLPPSPLTGASAPPVAAPPSTEASASPLAPSPPTEASAAPVSGPEVIADDEANAQVVPTETADAPEERKLLDSAAEDPRTPLVPEPAAAFTEAAVATAPATEVGASSRSAAPSDPKASTEPPASETGPPARDEPATAASETASASSAEALRAADASPPVSGAPKTSKPRAPAAPTARARPSAPAPSRSSKASASTDTVSVLVLSRPAGAWVKIDKRVFGRTPIPLRFRPGILFELTFAKPGYQTTRKRFFVANRRDQKVTAYLNKVSSRPESSKKRR